MTASLRRLTRETSSVTIHLELPNRLLARAPIGAGARIARKSLTLMRVGPRTIRSPRFAHIAQVSFGEMLGEVGRRRSPRA